MNWDKGTDFGNALAATLIAKGWYKSLTSILQSVNYQVNQISSENVFDFFNFQVNRKLKVINESNQKEGKKRPIKISENCQAVYKSLYFMPDKPDKLRYPVD